MPLERLAEPEINNLKRAFIIIGGIDIGLENLYLCLKDYKKINKHCPARNKRTEITQSTMSNINSNL